MPTSRVSRRSIGFLAAALAVGVSGAAIMPAAFAKATKTERGGTLVVPNEHSSLGTVYYLHTGKDAQVTFTSDAPLEHIKGVSSQVIGYAVVAPAKDGAPAKLVAGEFHLPIVSLDTGIPMRDEHLQGQRWLDAASYPDVVFTLAEVRDVKLVSETADATTYSATLVGDMTIKATTKEMSIPARYTLMAASEKTRTRLPGDLLALRCKYTVKLSDFGVADQSVGLKVADEMEIDTALFMSTVSPDAPRPGPGR